MAALPDRTASTIYSVAERAGVSIATVSRVLQNSQVVSDKTRDKVLDAVTTLNYVPLAAARSLAVRRHEAHGLVLPELSGPYYAELLLGFETRAAQLGQSVVLLLAEGKPDLAKALRQLVTRVDGIAALGSPSLVRDVVGTVGSSKPLVLIAGDTYDGVESISAENSRSAAAITAHLMVVHGRRSLLFVGDPQAAPDVEDRYLGFVEAHTGLHRRAREPVRVAFREADGEGLADRILRGSVAADALVCANDELALSIMARLQDKGRHVPDDLAVVGWDDVMAARYVRPGLTTVRQPVADLGAMAAERLHRRFADDTTPQGPRVLPTELVIRASCGCTAKKAPIAAAPDRFSTPPLAPHEARKGEQ